ncbi:MAG: scyllo-inositol 2-dehydrogenase [Micromonosporaceae bacterium]
MRVGIVGYGLAGRVFHGRLLAGTAGVDVVAIVTRDPARRAAAATDFPAAACFADVAAMLSGVPLDLAVVASATAAHAANAVACLTAGVPVVVDKPLAPTAAEAAEVVAAAARAGVPLTVFQNRRYDADIRTLRRLLADGHLGTVPRFESRFERWRPQPDLTRWRERASAAEGGGVLLDLGSHLADQAYALFGPVRSVYAELDARRGGADDDAFLALTHEEGTRSHLWCGAVTAAPGPRLRVLGSRAALVVDELDRQEAALRAGSAPGKAVAQPMRLVRGAEVEPVVPEPGAWDGFYPAVLAALRDGTPMPVDPADAVAVLRILDAARESAATGEVVRLTTGGGW